MFLAKHELSAFDGIRLVAIQMRVYRISIVVNVLVFSMSIEMEEGGVSVCRIIRSVYIKRKKIATPWGENNWSRKKVSTAPMQ